MTRDESRTFTRRRLFGLLGSAGVASLAGCGGRDTTPTATPEKPGPFKETSDSPDESPKMRDGIGFDRVVNAVDDLGWDPSGEEAIDNSVDQNLREGTLIEVPPGTYRVKRRHDVEGVSRWGIVGIGTNRRAVQFTPPAGRSFRWLMVDGGSDILIKNFTMQQGRKFDRSIGMGFLVDDGLKLYNVEKAGSNPRENSGSGAENGIVVQVTKPDGVAVVDTFVRKGPQDFAHYPGNAITVFTGRGHLGTVYYRNLHIENGGEHGIYASKGQGNVRVEGGLFKNNLGDGVRIAGEGSWVKGATVIIDMDDRTPGNRGNWHQARGIHLQSGEYGYTGGLVEDCTVIAHASPRTEALLKIEHSQGAATVKNCRFFNNTEYRTIVVDKPATGPQRPKKPWEVTFENIEISGRASNTVAMLLEDRPGSKISNVTIDLPGVGVDGIVLNNCEGTVIDNMNVVTGGYPLRVSSNSDGEQCLVTLKNLRRLKSSLLSDADTEQLASSLSGSTCLGGTDTAKQTFAVIGANDDRLYGTVLDEQ
ncbi:right-handed parallel beta-helix repeat-containing protein [Halogeometricum borinquense]|uniref:right-handed parallel beta-helix repeat-containing protein n=1 Tax=Halogeometricum borinquense TaxID=60847 RepID=UPI0034218844